MIGGDFISKTNHDLFLQLIRSDLSVYAKIHSYYRIYDKFANQGSFPTKTELTNVKQYECIEQH